MRLVLGCVCTCDGRRNPKLVPHATVTPLERPERFKLGIEYRLREISGGRKEGVEVKVVVWDQGSDYLR